MWAHGDMTKKEKEKVCPGVHQWFGTTFTNNKAGMAEVDKDKVKRVVYEMSKVCHCVVEGSLTSSEAKAAPARLARTCNTNPPAVVRLACTHAGLLPHFRHGLRLQAQTEERIRRMKQQAQGLTPAQLLSHTRWNACLLCLGSYFMDPCDVCSPCWPGMRTCSNIPTCMPRKAIAV